MLATQADLAGGRSLLPATLQSAEARIAFAPAAPRTLAVDYLAIAAAARKPVEMMRAALSPVAIRKRAFPPALAARIVPRPIATQQADSNQEVARVPRLNRR
jgi:hypothetical protein